MEKKKPGYNHSTREGGREEERKSEVAVRKTAIF